MAMVLALLAALSQDSAADLVGRLEEKAAAAHGLVLRSHAVLDSLASDELLERACASGRIEVTPEGSIWDEGWATWIGPERNGVTTLSLRTLTTPLELLQLARELRGFGPKMGEKRLETRPRGGPWKASPTLDPFLSRDQANRADLVDPLLLYALEPGLLRTESELGIGKSDDEAWILECRRPGRYGDLTKSFTIRKKDLALLRVVVRHPSFRTSYEYEFEAASFDSVGALTYPSRVSARFVSNEYLVRWSYRPEKGASAASRQGRKEFPEATFATPGLLDRNQVELRHVLEPANPQPLADLAWGEFPWRKWWSYRYFEDLKNNRWMLAELRQVDPHSLAAREEWLRRPGPSGPQDGESASEGAPGPLYNHAALLFEAGSLDRAGELARRALTDGASSGDRLNWTCLECARLSQGGKRKEAAQAWLGLLRSLDDGEASTAIFLTEVALGRGLSAGFDRETLAGDPEGLGAALLLVASGPGAAYSDAVRRSLKAPSARPLLGELLSAAPAADPELRKDLAAVADLDLLLGAAALARAGGEPTEELCDQAISLWEKESVCRPWTWEVGGRPTVRMLRRLRALGQPERARRLAVRFVERCAEGKVSSWLGIYRWGERVGEELESLRDREGDERFVEVLALSPELAARMAFMRFENKKRLVLPAKAMADHLRKTQDPREASVWAHMAVTLRTTSKEAQALVALAREVAPDDLWVHSAVLEMGAELPTEEVEAMLRRMIAAMKAGTWRDGTGGNYGASYDRLANLELKAGHPDQAAATALEMIREYPDQDSMSLLNLSFAMGRAGRHDLERTLLLGAARHNAHMRPFSAQTAVERLEKAGELLEAYALCVRTLVTWKDGGKETFDGRSLESVRAVRDRVAGKVSWEEVFKPWLDAPHPVLSSDEEKVARQALEDLRSDSIKVRDRAGRILRLLGEGAAAGLRPLALEGPPEDRGRAREILEEIYVSGWK